MSALEEAGRRARRIYPKSKGFREAYLRGARAAISGRAIDECPYARDPGKTWRLSWRLAWLGGYRSIVGEASES